MLLTAIRSRTLETDERLNMIYRYNLDSMHRESYLGLKL